MCCAKGLLFADACRLDIVIAAITIQKLSAKANPLNREIIATLLHQIDHSFGPYLSFKSK